MNTDPLARLEYLILTLKLDLIVSICELNRFDRILAFELLEINSISAALNT